MVLGGLTGHCSSTLSKKGVSDLCLLQLVITGMQLMQVKLEHRSKDINCAKMLSDLDFPPVLAFVFLYLSFTEAFFLFIHPL